MSAAHAPVLSHNKFMEIAQCPWLFLSGPYVGFSMAQLALQDRGNPTAFMGCTKPAAICPMLFRHLRPLLSISPVQLKPSCFRKHRREDTPFQLQSRLSPLDNY